MFGKRKRRQAKAGRDTSSLGNVLVDLGYCSRDSVAQTLRQQIESRPLLGQMLIDQGIITPDQLDHALLRQQVLRGKDEPSKLKAYGAEPRRNALESVADRLKRIAESASILADKLHR